MNTPHSQPPPPHGGKGLCYIRVSASEATQPRGLARTLGDIPLDCFAATRLAMTRALLSKHEGTAYFPSITVQSQPNVVRLSGS